MNLIQKFNIGKSGLPNCFGEYKVYENFFVFAFYELKL